MPGSGIDKKYGNDELAMSKQYSNDGNVNLDALIKRLTGGKKIKKKYDGKPPLYPDLDKAQYEPDGKLVDEENTDIKPLDVLLKNAVPAKINTKRKKDPNMTSDMLKRYRNNFLGASYQPEGEVIDEKIGAFVQKGMKMLSKVPIRKVGIGGVGLGAITGVGAAIKSVLDKRREKKIEQDVDKYVSDRQLKGGPKKVEYKPNDQYTVTRDEKGKVTGTGKLIRVQPGTRTIVRMPEPGERTSTKSRFSQHTGSPFKASPLNKNKNIYGLKTEATMTPAQKRKDTMLKKKYEKSDDMMDNFKDQYGEKRGKEVFYAYIRKKSMQVEQLGGTAPKVAPSSQEMKKKLTTVKNNNLEFGNISQRQKIQGDLEKMGNQRVTTTTTSTGAGGLNNMSISDAGTVKSFNANAINKLGKMGGVKLEMDSGGLVPNLGKFVQDVGKNTLAKNTLVPDAMKGELNKGLATTAQKINQETPGTDAFKQKTIAMQINKNTRKNQNLKASYNMDENITDEALTIQDWNSDDIKFTEIETVDIIKPKPLRPSPSNWREELGEDWQKVNKKDKTDGMSQKAVNAYKRENPGSKLKTAVTTKPSKLKKGSKASKRRKSFCARSNGQKKMHNIDCSKTPDKAICKARRRWNC